MGQENSGSAGLLNNPGAVGHASDVTFNKSVSQTSATLAKKDKKRSAKQIQAEKEREQREEAERKKA